MHECCNSFECLVGKCVGYALSCSTGRNGAVGCFFHAKLAPFFSSKNESTDNILRDFMSFEEDSSHLASFPNQNGRPSPASPSPNECDDDEIPGSPELQQGQDNRRTGASQQKKASHREVIIAGCIFN